MVIATSRAAPRPTITSRWIIPKPQRTHPSRKAPVGRTRSEGRGRSAVRRIRASSLISINWLNTADPKAAEAVPSRVWKRSRNRLTSQSPAPLRVATRNPKKVVNNTNVLRRSLIRVARSSRRLGLAPAALDSESPTSSVTLLEYDPNSLPPQSRGAKDLPENPANSLPLQLTSAP